MKYSGVTILQGVELSIFLLIFEWALQQCSATALPVITYHRVTVARVRKAHVYCVETVAHHSYYWALLQTVTQTLREIEVIFSLIEIYKNENNVGLLSSVCHDSLFEISEYSVSESDLFRC